MAFWKIINRVIDESNILIEVLDARFPELTRNKEIEDKIVKKDKKLLFVINKCDLVDKEILEDQKKELKKTAPCVFISSKGHLGTNYLREAIMKLSKGKEVKVGVLGYPNTGKSSLINALKGRQAAKTSSMSGYTKAKQLIRVSGKIQFLDTPGVYSYKEKDIDTLAIFSAVDYTKIKDPDIAAYKIIEMFKEKICKHYDIKFDKSPEIILENLAKKKNKLKKGNELDMIATSKELLKDWQKGKISLR